MTFIDASSWLGALGRSLNSEGRKSTMLHIRQIVTQAIAAINDYYETEFCQLIVNHLAQSKIGLANLASTYESDPNIKANIDIIIVDIDLQLNRHKKLLDGHADKSHVHII